ncbi:MAG: 50S ribosomal protein L10 [Oscillospiraceae bacterium]|nr:50S ribosomal protein L10 [Oscillospiraceae bacterium]MDE5885046.1 50S ribosomal protein L10 [Oscillospiraceae bacterium]
MPSEKILASKQARVAELSELLKKSVAVVLVDYKGITVEQDTQLRKELREAGIQYFVEKNTMLKRAFNENGVTDFDDVLNGTTAIAVSENDQTAAARILGEFAEKSETFKLKAGSVEGEYFDETKIMALSKIPSKDVLLAQLVGSLQGPIQKLAALLKAVAEKDSEQEAA